MRQKFSNVRYELMEFNSELRHVHWKPRDGRLSVKFVTFLLCFWQETLRFNAQTEIYILFCIQYIALISLSHHC
jgi:hypothetical protein